MHLLTTRETSPPFHHFCRAFAKFLSNCGYSRLFFLDASENSSRHVISHGSRVISAAPHIRLTHTHKHPHHRRANTYCCSLGGPALFAFSSPFFFSRARSDCSTLSSIFFPLLSFLSFFFSLPRLAVSVTTKGKCLRLYSKTDMRIGPTVRKVVPSSKRANPSTTAVSGVSNGESAEGRTITKQNPSVGIGAKRGRDSGGGPDAVAKVAPRRTTTSVVSKAPSAKGADNAHATSSFSSSVSAAAPAGPSKSAADVLQQPHRGGEGCGSVGPTFSSTVHEGAASAALSAAVIASKVFVSEATHDAFYLELDRALEASRRLLIGLRPPPRPLPPLPPPSAPAGSDMCGPPSPSGRPISFFSSPYDLYVPLPTAAALGAYGAAESMSSAVGGSGGWSVAEQRRASSGGGGSGVRQPSHHRSPSAASVTSSVQLRRDFSQRLTFSVSAASVPRASLSQRPPASATTGIGGKRSSSGRDGAAQTMPHFPIDGNQNSGNLNSLGAPTLLHVRRNGSGTPSARRRQSLGGSVDGGAGAAAAAAEEGEAEWYNAGAVDTTMPVIVLVAPQEKQHGGAACMVQQYTDSSRCGVGVAGCPTPQRIAGDHQTGDSFLGGETLLRAAAVSSDGASFPSPAVHCGSSGKRREGEEETAAEVLASGRLRYGSNGATAPSPRHLFPSAVNDGGGGKHRDTAISRRAALDCGASAEAAAVRATAVVSAAEWLLRSAATAAVAPSFTAPASAPPPPSGQHQRFSALPLASNRFLSVAGASLLSGMTAALGDGQASLSNNMFSPLAAAGGHGFSHSAIQRLCDAFVFTVSLEGPERALVASGGAASFDGSEQPHQWRQQRISALPLLAGLSMAQRRGVRSFEISSIAGNGSSESARRSGRCLSFAASSFEAALSAGGAPSPFACASFATRHSGEVGAPIRDGSCFVASGGSPQHKPHNDSACVSNSHAHPHRAERSSGQCTRYSGAWDFSSSAASPEAGACMHVSGVDASGPSLEGAATSGGEAAAIDSITHSGYAPTLDCSSFSSTFPNALGQMVLAMTGAAAVSFPDHSTDSRGSLLAEADPLSINGSASGSRMGGAVSVLEGPSPAPLRSLFSQVAIATRGSPNPAICTHSHGLVAQNKKVCLSPKGGHRLRPRFPSIVEFLPPEQLRTLFGPPPAGGAAGRGAAWRLGKWTKKRKGRAKAAQRSNAIITFDTTVVTHTVAHAVPLDNTPNIAACGPSRSGAAAIIINTPHQQTAASVTASFLPPSCPPTCTRVAPPPFAARGVPPLPSPAPTVAADLRGGNHGVHGEGVAVAGPHGDGCHPSSLVCYTADPISLILRTESLLTFALATLVRLPSQAHESGHSPLLPPPPASTSPAAPAPAFSHSPVVSPFADSFSLPSLSLSEFLSMLHSKISLVESSRAVAVDGFAALRSLAAGHRTTSLSHVRLSTSANGERSSGDVGRSVCERTVGPFSERLASLFGFTEDDEAAIAAAVVERRTRREERWRQRVGLSQLRPMSELQQQRQQQRQRAAVLGKQADGGTQQQKQPKATVAVAATRRAPSAAAAQKPPPSFVTLPTAASLPTAAATAHVVAADAVGPRQPSCAPPPPQFTTLPAPPLFSEWPQQTSGHMNQQLPQGHHSLHRQQPGTMLLQMAQQQQQSAAAPPSSFVLYPHPSKGSISGQTNGHGSVPMGVGGGSNPILSDRSRAQSMAQNVSANAHSSAPTAGMGMGVGPAFVALGSAPSARHHNAHLQQSAQPQQLSHQLAPTHSYQQRLQQHQQQVPSSRAPIQQSGPFVQLPVRQGAAPFGHPHPHPQQQPQQQYHSNMYRQQQQQQQQSVFEYATGLSARQASAAALPVANPQQLTAAASNSFAFDRPPPPPPQSAASASYQFPSSLSAAPPHQPPHRQFAVSPPPTHNIFPSQQHTAAGVGLHVHVGAGGGRAASTAAPAAVQRHIF